MPRLATSTTYVYVDCPTCGRGIGQPFIRNGSAQIAVHQPKSGVRCRIVIWPGIGGERDRTFSVPDNLSLEEACEVYQPMLDAGGWLARTPYATAA